MSEAKLLFSPLVATPTHSSWAQAYTAGKLYAVLSLEVETVIDDDQSAQLASIGKEIINALVEEYFTLEVKKLDTIKTAITQTTKKIPQNLEACFVVVSIVNNILYAFSYGGGRVLLKRGEKVGDILHQNDNTHSVTAVSGYLQDNDFIVLQTTQSMDILTPSAFSASFANPDEATEMLSAKIHESEKGGAAAIVLSYREDQSSEITPFPTDETETEEAEEKEQEKLTRSSFHTQSAEEKSRKFSFPKLSFSFSFLPKQGLQKRLLFLFIPLLLLGILAASIYFTKKQQEESKRTQLFTRVYEQAQKEYDQGQALVSLNKPLANDNFLKAKKTIDENIAAFPKDSPQREKLQQLLGRIQQQGVIENSPHSLPAKKTDPTNNPLLSALVKTQKAAYVTQSNTTIYVGLATGIQTEKGKIVIENKNDWKKLSGLGAFDTNLYVLDSENNQILKFLNGSQSSKSVYASGTFSHAVAMAIDSSIYILSSDGSILKFTRGSKDAFVLTGLSTPLKNPTRIFTNADTEHIYVLDPQNSRVIALSKTGVFQQAYTASIIHQATDLDVHEKEKKLYVSTQDNIYEIELP